MITQYKIFSLRSNISVEIKRSDRKTIGLEVKPTGEVLARVPKHLSDREIKKFIDVHKKWIIEKVRLVGVRQQKKSTIEFPPFEELTQSERQVVKDRIAERVQYYSVKMDVTYGRISVRDQKTRWGSCSAKGNLNFNYRLCYMLDELLDYVVVHELSHRRYMNHSKEFWCEVETYFPAYRECRKRLRDIAI